MNSKASLAQDLGDFEEEDFQQFFGLIEDGKISKEKLEVRCVTKESGFTFTAKDLLHKSNLERLEYNETKLNASVDGRPLRSKYHNAAFGEWTGSIFKPICAGLYLISLDVTVASGDVADAEQTRIHIFLRREGEARPGRIMTTAHTSGEGRAAGHATLVLALRTGDEVSTYSQATGNAQSRLIERASFTAAKIAHIDGLIDEFDSEAWDADLIALENTASISTNTE